MKSRRQALKLCLDTAVVVIVKIFDELLFEVFHRIKFLQIEQFTLSRPKKFSITALSRQLPFRLMLCRMVYLYSLHMV